MRQPQLQNGNMNKRHRIGAKKSKRSFTKHAIHTRGANFVSGVMRGGIRF